MSPARHRSAHRSPAPRRRRRRTSWGAWIFWITVPVAFLGGLGALYLNDQILARFQGQRWTVPAKVYARPLELYAGQVLHRDQIDWELRELAYRASSARVLSPGEYRWQGARLFIRTRSFEFWDAIEPEQSVELSLEAGRVASLTLDGDEAGIARLEPRMIGGIYPAHNEDRILVTLEDVPPSLVEALIVTEDRDFYDHLGVSPRGILRAMVANVRAGGMRQGGSTLTQQLVKNFYLSSERTLSRKAMEAAMALLLERHASKQQILEAYLNEVFLGQAGARAIHGVGLASLYYFGQPLKDIGIEKQALLVALVRGASYYDPRRHPERATQRRNQVITMMAEHGTLSAEASAALQALPLGVTSKPLYEDNRYPGFMQLVQRSLRQEYDDEDLQSEGLRIFTTLDPWIQDRLEKAMSGRLGALQTAYPRAVPFEGAGVVTNPVTGEVVALMGGREARFHGFNRAVDTARPIGSLVKPAVYLAAIEKGYRLSRTLPDEPFTVELPTGDWSPNNYDGKSHGSVTLLEALSNSYNLATVRLAMDLGIDEVASVIERLGVNREVPRVPALSLGVLELSPLEVASMYQTMAAGGFNSPLRTVRSVLGSNGQPLQRYPLDVEERFDSANTYLITRAMQQTFISGTARGVASRFPGIMPAGKTGTTNDQRDSWFAGYSGNLLGVIWVGNDENKPTPLTGASGALSVWAELFTGVSLEPLQPVQPDNVQWDYFNPALDALTSAECPSAMYLPARIDTLPSTRVDCSGEAMTPDWVQDLFGEGPGDGPVLQGEESP